MLLLNSFINLTKYLHYHILIVFELFETIYTIRQKFVDTWSESFEHPCIVKRTCVSIRSVFFSIHFFVLFTWSLQGRALDTEPGFGPDHLLKVRDTQCSPPPRHRIFRIVLQDDREEKYSWCHPKSQGISPSDVRFMFVNLFIWLLTHYCVCIPSRPCCQFVISGSALTLTELM